MVSEFKLFDDLTLADERQSGFSRMDTGETITLRDRYAAVAALELSEGVPEDLRRAFDHSRNLWVYGWFYYPFHTTSVFHAYTTLEMALRWKKELVAGRDPKRTKEKSPGLRKLLLLAVESRWITDERIGHAVHLAERRREFIESFDPEWRGRLFPNYRARDPETQEYCRIIADTFPQLRNYMAHPEWFTYGMPRLLEIEVVRDLIEQLFQKLEGQDQAAGTGA